jgi:hypothetical protein
MKKVFENTKKIEAESLEKFKTFQKKCAGFLNELKGNAEEMLALVKEHRNDGSYFIMNGPKVVSENTKIILDIINNFLNDTSLTLEWISKENLTSNCHEHVYFYLVRFKYFNEQVQQTRINTAKLPTTLAAAVNKIVEKDKAVMYKFYKDFNEYLSFSSNYFYERCKKFIPPDIYGGIYDQKNNYSNPKLVQINAKYYESIQLLEKEKKEEFRKILSSLNGLLTDNNHVTSEQIIKTYLELFDILTAKFELYTNEVGGENSNLFSRFKALYSLELTLRLTFETMNVKAKSAIDLLQSEKSAENRKMILTAVQKVISDDLTHAEVKLRDQKKQRELERARRALVKEEEAAEMTTLLLQKKAKDQEQLQSAIKNKIKAQLHLAMQKLSKEERSFMEDMFNGNIPHRKIQEEFFETLITKLGLPMRPTNKSSGGFLITIHEETINYHHWHGDNPGTLDQALIKDFKKALEKLGIGKADLASVPLTATGQTLK